MLPTAPPISAPIMLFILSSSAVNVVSVSENKGSEAPSHRPMERAMNNTSVFLLSIGNRL